MNEFKLINELNEEYNLKNFKDYGLIPSIDGLGYENNMSYIRIGNTYKKNSSELSQGTISGNVIFSDYEKYQDFITYIERSNNLRIIYKPLDIDYFRDVDFNGITKVTQKGSTIECDIKLNCKGLYYTEDNKRFVVESVEGESRYPLPFPFIFNDYSSVMFGFNNVGHTEADIIAEIYGYIINPVIEMYVNGSLKSKVEFNITIEEGQKLVYSARDGDNYVYLVDSDGTQTNIVNCLSLVNDNFFKLPKGHSSLKMTSDAGTSNKVIFRFFTAYKGV